MFTLSIIEGVLLIIYVAYLVKEYAQQQIDFYIKFLTFISWLCSFGVVFLIPHDVYFALSDDEQSFDNQLWSAIYWINFILTWVVLPIIQEYEDAGEFTFEAKLMRSIKSNLLIYGLGAGVNVGAVFLIYLIAFNKLQWSAVIALFVALANCIGIVLIVLLLGYGLVAIPREYFRKSRYERSLNGLYQEAAYIEENKQTLINQLLEQGGILVNLKRQYDKHPLYFEYIETILSQIPYELIERVSKQKYGINEIQLMTNVSKLVELNRKVKKLTSELKRILTKWEKLCDECFLLEDLMENKYSVHYKIISTLRQPRNGRMGHMFDILIWFWYTRLKRIYLFSLGILFSLLSLIVLLGEISVFTNYDVNLLGHIIKNQGFIQIQLLVLIPLIYIAFCVFYGLFHLKLFGVYGFFNHQQTDAPSLMFGSINFSRVSFPLTYNVLQMLRIKDTPFSEVIGDMDIVPIFGVSFQYTLPVMLIFASVFNFFQLSKLTNPPNYDGQKLVCRARVQKERELLNQNNESIFAQKFTIKNSYKYYAFKNLDNILKI